MDDLYEILDVSPTATQAEIKRAFRRIAQATHPDKLVGATEAARAAAQRRFVQAKAAYDVLSDPEKRASYDRRRASGDLGAADDFDETDHYPEPWLIVAASLAVNADLSQLAEFGIADRDAVALASFVRCHLTWEGRRSTPIVALRDAYGAATKAYTDPSLHLPVIPVPELVAGFVTLVWRMNIALWEMLPETSRDGLRPPPPPPGIGCCSVCGDPRAVSVTFWSLKGRFFSFETGKLPGFFCRNCGQALGREMQTTTLNQGWWGFISFVLTPIYAALNAQALYRVGNLAPSRSPVPPGVPVYRRRLWGLWIALAIIAWYLWSFMQGDYTSNRQVRRPVRSVSVAVVVDPIDRSLVSSAAASDTQERVAVVVDPIDPSLVSSAAASDTQERVAVVVDPIDRSLIPWVADARFPRPSRSDPPDV